MAPSETTPDRARDRGSLTPRQREVLELLTAGHSSRDIAARLGITTDTAEDHVRSIYRKLGARPARPNDEEHLTRREHEILSLLAAGHTTSDIAHQLTIAPNTVKTHLTSIYRKTGARNRVQAARYYLDRGIARPDA